MNPIALIFRLRFAEFRNQFRAFREESAFKITVLGAFAFLFWFGLYLLFLSGFRFVERQMAGADPDLLINMLLSLFFFSLLILLTFSNGIISFASLFRSEETSYLISAPIQFENIFLYKMMDAIVFSSWAFIFLGTPFMTAYGVFRGVPWYFYLLMVPLFGAFIFIPAAIGSFTALMISRFLPRKKRHVMLILFGFLAIAIAAIGTNVLELRGNVQKGEEFHQVREIVQVFDFSEHPLLPSYWLTKAIWKFGDFKSPPAFRAGMMFLGLLVANALFFTTLVYWLAWKIYRDGWNIAQGMRKSRRTRERGWITLILKPFMPLVSRPVQVFVLKDVKSFVRDPAQWSQCLIFFGLLAVYFLNLRTIGYDSRNFFWKNLIAQLNLGATCMTLATFTSRFVFPQISLEGRRFWIVGMAPIRHRDILYGKFFFSLIGSIIIAESLIILSSVMLDIPIEIAVLQAIAVLGVCIGLSGISVGLGAIYPNFREDNPSKIISGFGGTLNLVVSMAFVFIIVVAQAIPCHRFYGFHALTNESYLRGLNDFYFWIVVLIVGIMAFAFATASVMLHFGVKRFEKVEI